MGSHWSWRQRRRFLFFVKVLGWALYLFAVVAGLLLFAPFVFQHPAGAAIALGTFVAIPAGLQFIWILNPGYFYVSRLRVDSSVTEHVRPGRAGRAEASCLSNLHDVPTTGHPGSASIISVRTDWDRWLYVASVLAGEQNAGPRTSSIGRLEISPRGAELRVGYWRPGVVLRLPAPNIVGLWKGSELPTIGGDRVVVLAVRAGGDVIPFPFQVHRWSSGRWMSRSVEDLLSEIESAWATSRGEPASSQGTREGRR